MSQKFKISERTSVLLISVYRISVSIN